MFKLGLHHLETLCLIHRLGSFAAAADQLNTTQSAISSRVKEMESRLKTSLFRKEGRRMALTMRGRDLVRRSEPLLQQMNGVLLSAMDDDNPFGMVSLGLGESAAMTWLPAFLQRMSRVMPNIGWDITVDVTQNLRQRIIDGTLDIGVMAAPVDGQSLLAKPIARIDLTWMASSSFVDSRGGRVSLQDGPVWSLPRPSYHYYFIAAAIRAARVEGVPMPTINTCNHVQTLIKVIAAGSGMAMLPEQQVRDRVANGEFQKLPFSQPTHTIDFAVVRRHEEADTIVLKVFDQALKMKMEAWGAD